MNGSHDRQDSDAEDHVVASLEQRKQQMHAVPKDSAMQRISHLPMLLKRMKSTSIRPDDDGDDHDEGELRLSKAGHAKEYPKLPPPRRSDNNGQKSTKKWFERRGRQPKTDKDAFFDNALHLQTLMKEDSDTSDDTDDDESVSTTADDDVEYGGETLTEKSNLLKKKKRQKKRRKMKSKLRSQWRRLMVTLRPEDIQVTILEFLRKDVTLIMLPMLTVAFILYYLLDNPDLVFLPNSATLAWYLLFVVRLQVTFALARVSQFLLEIVSIRTSLLAQWSGPFVTLVAMQSLGWPFLLLAWGVWNILILHGSSPFIRHWLCFTGMAIFSPEHNPDGDGVLQSEIYGRILSTLVCVGALSALKRTTVALYLSRRMLSNYKPQLIKTMNEVHLITGIAGLAAEADKPGFDELVEEASQDAAAQIQMDRKVKYMDDVPTFSSSDDDNKQSREVLSSFEKLADNKQGKRDQWKALKDQALHNDPTEAAKDAAVRGGHTDEKLAARRFDHVMSTLDRWEPPSEPNEKESASLQEILEFKKAMARMSDNFPFSHAFGPADIRQNCISSAIRVYSNLLKFTPEVPADDDLGFDVIGALAYEEDGSINAKRAQGLLRLFLPDQNNKVTLQAFVQTCDSVYKRMLFLRASLNNASKIDSVLEECFNIIFYGVLAVITLSMVGYNPWPLLVSFSTLLVSFTFAVGPSAAKVIEGILSIAVRRPFDLGDRIILCKPEEKSKLSETYIVEDINLTTTTLRFAQTNEVSTVNNWSLTTARIVNCARSPKACIRILAKFNTGASLEKLDTLKSRLEDWLSKDPRSWAGLVQFVTDIIDRDNALIVYKIGVLHVKPWQDISSVMKSKGDLECEVDRISFELGIHYNSVPTRHKVFLQEKKNN